MDTTSSGQGVYVINTNCNQVITNTESAEKTVMVAV